MWYCCISNWIVGITLLTNGFPVVMYRCESWTIKKAEHQKIDAFELWYWGRLLRGPWTARRSSQSILKEISSEYSLEGLNIHWCWRWSSSTLATWCEELADQRRPWWGKDWRQEEKGTTEEEMVGRHHWLDGHEFEQAAWVGDGQGSLACCSPWGHKVSNPTEQLNWIEIAANSWTHFNPSLQTWHFLMFKIIYCSWHCYSNV